MKNVFHLKKAFTMLMTLVVPIAVYAGNSESSQSIATNKSELREVGSFDELEISGAFTVLLTQGNEENVLIEADSDVLSNVITKVEGSTLKIYIKKKLRSSDKVALVINFKNLKEIDCSGANTLSSSGPLKFDNFSFDASGACKVDMELTANKFEIDMSGSTHATFKGKASKVELEISGAGKYLASSMVADEYEIEISGTGNAEVFAGKKLEAAISGTGKVRYLGNPEITKSISGTGTVKQLE